MDGQEKQGLDLKKQPYMGSLEELCRELGADLDQGLDSEELNRRRELYGANRLEAEEKEPLWHKFLMQFADFMVLILIVASLISAALGDWIESVVILAIVVVNAILGVYQEGQAEKAIEALQKLSSPRARVLRGGRQELVDSEDLVPGDVVLLEAGDIVPADLRLLESVNLKVEEASLTGESVPVEKDAGFETLEDVALADRANMLFSSTSVTYGRARAVVTGTGADTEIGRIASRLKGIQNEATPLQENLNKLGKVLGLICLLVCAIVFVVGVLRGGELLNTFMIAVSLAVAAIPEGLQVVVTIVLALGMKRMADEHAIVKRLLAVETLGSVDTICSDKTGTLTQNEMTVKRIWAGSEAYRVTGVGYENNGQLETDAGPVGQLSPALKRLFDIATLCNDALLQPGDQGKLQVLGDPTEAAMLTAAAKGGVRREELLDEHSKRAELPFDSERKMMTVFYDGYAEAPCLSFTKGAPDIVLARSTHYMDSEGQQRPLTEELRQEILGRNSAYAQEALRVLGFAYRAHQQAELAEAEQGLCFVGLMGMIDPARPEAKAAIEVCRVAGIRPVMITGDHKETAWAIAKDLKLMHEGDGALSGSDLDQLSDEELRQVVEHTAVFARVSPEHKVRIVSALRDQGHIASMTGDGVNDAPALKQADIGVAMGITGTEVAKGAADMILTDDNFATIVHAVEQGRVIFANIRKFVSFLLSCNVGEILVIFLISMIMGPAYSPLVAIQLLWLNLVTDSFPALALGRERAESGVMLQPPRSKSENIINRDMIWSIAVQAVAIFVAIFAAFQLGRYFFPDIQQAFDQANPHVMLAPQDQLAPYFSFLPLAGFVPSHGARTFAFVALICAELLRAYSSRSERQSVFRQGIFSNRSMVYATLVSLGLLLLVIYVPFLDVVFMTVSLSPLHWLCILPCALLPFVVGEVFKAVYYRRERQQG